MPRIPRWGVAVGAVLLAAVAGAVAVTASSGLGEPTGVPSAPPAAESSVDKQPGGSPPVESDPEEAYVDESPPPETDEEFRRDAESGRNPGERWTPIEGGGGFRTIPDEEIEDYLNRPR